VIEAEGKAKAIVLQLESEAEGHARAVRLQADADASAIRARGEAEAAALRLRGLAEAEAIKARGLAEAESLQRRVAALNEQNQAAILDNALTGRPEIAGRLFEAYSRIGNVTYISSGQGDGVTQRITQDVVGMVPLLGAVFESATGLKLRDLIGGQQPASSSAEDAPPAIQGADAPSESASGAVPEVAVIVSTPGNGSVNVEEGPA